MLMTTGVQFLNPGWALLSVKFCPMQATEADFVTFWFTAGTEHTRLACKPSEVEARL